MTLLLILEQEMENRYDFNPIPSVDIVLLRLQLNRTESVSAKDQKLFKDFVTYIFSRPVKNLRGGVLSKRLNKRLFTKKQIAIIEKQHHIDFNKKPSQIPFEKWVLLFQSFKQHVDKDKQKIVWGSFVSLMRQQKKLQKKHRTRKFSK